MKNKQNAIRMASRSQLQQTPQAKTKMQYWPCAIWRQQQGHTQTPCSWAAGPEGHWQPEESLLKPGDGEATASQLAPTGRAFGGEDDEAQPSSGGPEEQAGLPDPGP